jgi:dihydroneopterin aldolase/2-amino-4-hydroxy-6-hydroxymethyldihydropteridine diphosphokinase
MNLEYVSVEIERKWHTAYIGLGSNIGAKNKNLQFAIEIIKSDVNNKGIKISRFYETKPVVYREQDDFLKGVLELKTLLSPEELMDFLLDIEIQLKRERNIRWGRGL